MRPMLNLKPTLFRYIHISRASLSQVDPSSPYTSHLYKIKKPGRLFKEPLDENLVLGQKPLYTAPNTAQIAFSKRWSLGFFSVGAYVAYLCTGLADVSLLTMAGCLVPLTLPFPLIQYFTKSYTTRIFRVYNKNEPQTYENLTKDETLMVEKLSLFGWSTYGVPIKVKHTYFVNKRLGWINWVYIDQETGAMTKMYVEDSIGGIKMDRLWGIVEGNSGVDNGREFLVE